MHHEVVRAQHAGVAHDLGANVLHQLGRRRLAQEGIDGVTHQPHAAQQNKGAHGETCPAVEVNPRYLRENGAGKHRAGGDAIVSRVHRRCRERLRRNALAHGAHEGRHPQLDDDGKHEHHHQREREFSRLGG